MRIVAPLLTYVPRRLNGAFLTTHAFLKGLAEAGHQVDVVTTGSHQAYDHEGVVVHPRSMMRKIAVAAEVMITHHGHDPLPMFSGPRVTMAHGEHRLPLPNNLVWFGTEATHAFYGWEGPSLVTPPPINPTAYDVGRRGGPRHVTLVGLTPAKGVNVWADVAARLPEHRFLGAPSAVGGQHRPLGANIECLRETVTDMRQVYARTKVLLMPSVTETYGRVGIEAMCSGIPVIAHPTAGMMEAFGDAATFIERDNIDAWVETVRNLMTDEALYRQASERASAHVAGLDYAASVERFVDAVEGLLL